MNTTELYTLDKAHDNRAARQEWLTAWILHKVDSHIFFCAFDKMTKEERRCWAGQLLRKALPKIALKKFNHVINVALERRLGCISLPYVREIGINQSSKLEDKTINIVISQNVKPLFYDRKRCHHKTKYVEWRMHVCAYTIFFKHTLHMTPKHVSQPYLRTSLVKLSISKCINESFCHCTIDTESHHLDLQRLPSLTLQFNQNKSLHWGRSVNVRIFM